MAALLNRARMSTATTGTGTVTLGSAMTGYFSFAEAGAVNATVYSYTIEDGDDFEIGVGTYTSSGTTFSRDTVTASKIGGTAGTSKIDLSGNANIFITVRAQDTLAASGEITNAKLANMAQNTFKGRVTSGTGVPEDLTAAQAASIISAGKPAFLATKGGTDQTGIAPSTATIVTFGTEVFDVGGYYDTANSYWLPPAGTYVVTCSCLVTAGLVDQTTQWLLIYQGASTILYTARNPVSGTAAQRVFITGLVQANGTDYIQIKYREDGAGNNTIFGGAGETYFFGYQL